MDDEGLYVQNEEGGGGETEDSGGHEGINDFGIGTLVLAMALGTVSRMYITHITG